MTRLPLLLVLPALLLLAPALAPAGEGGRVEDAWVEEALEAAGENRLELRKALGHFKTDPEAGAERYPRRLEAMRFLVANMLPHGYVITHLEGEDGKVIEYDPLAYDTFAESRDAIEALEKEHGSLRWNRGRLVKDVETIQADFLIRHIEEAFAAWEASPEATRVSFDTFLQYVLPYRGSQEPLDFWIGDLRQRYDGWWAETQGVVKDLHKKLSKDVHRRVRFNERYYLHPTDQGFKEMVVSGQGRCEDITNMMTYAARSLAVATAADYTPAWAHRDNNHAWNVLLDAEGRGSDRSNAHAAKVYRKTFALQRDNLAFQLEEDEKAPNRFLSSKTYVDVTDQYRATTDVEVELDPEIAKGHRFAYLCVFNGGGWTAIHWGPIQFGRVVFDRMGRNIVYLPAVFDGEELVPAAAPRLVHHNGTIERLEGTGSSTGLVVTAVRPRQKSVDTHVETPISFLKAGEVYLVQVWTKKGWDVLGEFTADDEPLRLEDLASDGLYWVVKKESRRLERVFTIQAGAQRWW